MGYDLAMIYVYWSGFHKTTIYKWGGGVKIPAALLYPKKNMSKPPVESTSLEIDSQDKICRRVVTGSNVFINYYMKQILVLIEDMYMSNFLILVIHSDCLFS